MIYTIAYEIRDEQRLSQLLSRINELGDNIQYLSNSVFLQNDNTTANQLYDDLRKITADEDRLLITQVSKSELMGWLNSNAVNWIREHN